MSDAETLPFPEAWTERPVRRRRRRWPWLVAALVVVALVVTAFVVVETVVKKAAEDAIRQQIVNRLGLAADQAVDVSLSGPLLIELVVGSIGEVHITAEDVAIETFAGDVDLTLRDVDVWGDHAIGTGFGTVSMDAPQVRGLLSGVDGFPTEALGLAAPDVSFTAQLSAFGASVPLGVALTPSAADGDILLTPSALTLGDARVTADDLRARFGAFADPVLRTWTVCIADRLPAGIPLTGVQVVGDRLVASFDVASRLAGDPALQARGTCP